MCCLLPLAALLLLSIVPSVTEVVESMSDCSEFLLKHTPPNVPGVLEGGRILDQSRYKVICQTLNKVRTFVTLYDTQNRIPVFSANKYRGVDGGKRPPPIWKIEPQLENIGNDKNMVPVSKDQIYNNQAGDIDYKDQTVYDRGHLFPCSYGATVDDKKATFTLTNIVPQEKSFNKGSWQRMESCIKCVLDEYCINTNNITEGFLVIGAQPGDDKLKDRVNIPSMLWNLYISHCYYHIFPSLYICPSHNYNWPRYYDNQYSLNYCYYHFGYHCIYNYRNTNNFYCTDTTLPMTTTSVVATTPTTYPTTTFPTTTAPQTTAAVSSTPQTATTTLSNISVTSDSTDLQLTLAPTTTDLAKMSTEPLISPTSQSSLSISSSSKVTTFPFTDSLHRTSTAAFQTTNASHPTFSVSQSPSATSVARLIISTHSQPSPSAPSQTSVPPATFKPPLPPSNSSTLCPPLTQFAISQYYQNVLAFYQVLHQYHSNN
ncbi:hypothetical protein ABVT39_009686 [Epinephelus coioides]